MVLALFLPAIKKSQLVAFNCTFCLLTALRDAFVLAVVAVWNTIAQTGLRNTDRGVTVEHSPAGIAGDHDISTRHRPLRYCTVGNWFCKHRLTKLSVSNAKRARTTLTLDTKPSMLIAVFPQCNSWKCGACKLCRQDYIRQEQCILSYHISYHIS